MYLLGGSGSKVAEAQGFRPLGPEAGYRPLGPRQAGEGAPAAADSTAKSRQVSASQVGTVIPFFYFSLFAFLCAVNMYLDPITVTFAKFDFLCKCRDIFRPKIGYDLMGILYRKLTPMMKSPKVILGGGSRGAFSRSGNNCTLVLRIRSFYLVQTAGLCKPTCQKIS